MNQSLNAMADVPTSLSGEGLTPYAHWSHFLPLGDAANAGMVGMWDVPYVEYLKYIEAANTQAN